MGTLYSVAGGTVQTLDAVPTLIYTLALAINTTYLLVAQVVARKSDGSERAGFTLTQRAHREGAGALLGGVELRWQDKTDAAWDIAFVINGNNIELKVTGKLVTTIDWSATINWTRSS